MMWAKRVLIGSGVAVASVLMVPAVSGAATNCVQTQSMQEPTCVVVPAVNSSSGTVTPAASGGGKSDTALPASEPGEPGEQVGSAGRPVRRSGPPWQSPDRT